MHSRILLAELEATVAAGLPCVCCTVVATRGSTPQKAGATMLVYATGTQSGTLGGGCVEAEVRRRALESLAAGDGKAAFHTFTLDDDYGWDDGLICGGRMTILADPLDTTAGLYFTKLRELVDIGAGFTEVIELANGAKYLFDSDGKPIASQHKTDHWPKFSKCTKPKVVDGLAILPTLPQIQLLIVGGGHIGQAVAKLAADLEFDVWVVDDRDSLVSEERFPRASRRIVGDIGHTLKALVPEITPRMYCLIVTRGHNHDEEALYHLAPTAAGYVGMIGSKRKVKLIFDDLRVKGISDEALARVRAPVGLEIGSQTVGEIAVSIVAELIARRSGKG
jgi:xanthine dehydrogenase accessory factor